MWPNSELVHLRQLTLCEVSDTPLNSNPTTTPHDSSTPAKYYNGLISLPWDKMLGRPLVGSAEGLGSILAVGRDLTKHIVTFLHNVQHMRPIIMLPLARLALTLGHAVASKQHYRRYVRK